MDNYSSSDKGAARNKRKRNVNGSCVLLFAIAADLAVSDIRVNRRHVL